MNEREGFDARQEAKREAAGPVNKETRDRLWGGLNKYLSAEARHARAAAAAERRASARRER